MLYLPAAIEPSVNLQMTMTDCLYIYPQSDVIQMPAILDETNMTNG